MNSQEDEVWVKIILRLLIVSIRELEVAELQAAVETWINDERYNFKEFLEVECGSFLHLLPSSRGGITVQMIHETFASFLVDSRRSQLSEYLIDKSEAHSEVAALCLDVLCSATSESNIFLEYALNSWVCHLHNTSNSGDQA